MLTVTVRLSAAQVEEFARPLTGRRFLPESGRVNSADLESIGAAVVGRSLQVDLRSAPALARLLRRCYSLPAGLERVNGAALRILGHAPGARRMSMRSLATLIESAAHKVDVASGAAGARPT